MLVAFCLLWNRLGMWLHYLALFMWVSPLKVCSFSVPAYQGSLLSKWKLLWQGMWSKVLLKAVCVFVTCLSNKRLQGCKTKLSKREGSTSLTAFWGEAFLALFMLFQFAWATFPPLLIFPLRWFWVAFADLKCLEKRGESRRWYCCLY